MLQSKTLITSIQEVLIRVRFLKPLLICLCLIAFLGVSSVTSAATFSHTQESILYVKPGATGNCGSWVDACNLQTALTKAMAGDQIWVTAGTYKPTTITDRAANFQLITGVAIYGGFAGTETNLAERDWVNNITTLSGDIGIPDDKTDNSYHVVIGSGVNFSAILDGFTITAGYATPYSSHPNGGGMYIDSGSPTLKNITFLDNLAMMGGAISNNNGDPLVENVSFLDNSASLYGGGIYNTGNSHPTFVEVVFSTNTAEYSGGGMYNTMNSSPTLSKVTFNNNTAVYYGGGITNHGSGRSTLTDVTFSGNSAPRGGGIYNYFVNSILTNVTFSGNYASEDGGGIFNNNSNIKLVNSILSGNSAVLRGGGIHNYASSPTLTNVTLFGNSAAEGAGIHNRGSSNPNITNAILWGNTPDQILDSSSTTTINYSVIQGSHTGTGNIDQDPLLGPLADNGGFTKTQALDAGSPAIDTGSNTVCLVVDQRGYMRPVDGNGDTTAICDMGAYEYASSLATFSLSAEINGGGSVTKNPDKPSYQFGDVVTLTAIPDPVWSFSYWGGDIFATKNPLIVIIPGNISTTAVFFQINNFLPLISR